MTRTEAQRRLAEMSNQLRFTLCGLFHTGEPSACPLWVQEASSHTLSAMGEWLQENNDG